MMAAFAEWAAADGPPNAVFTVALLTHASTWTPAAARFAKKRLGFGNRGAGKDDAEGDGGSS